MKKLNNLRESDAFKNINLSRIRSKVRLALEYLVFIKRTDVSNIVEGPRQLNYHIFNASYLENPQSVNNSLSDNKDAQQI
jgi:hypothetical protein